MLPVYVSVGTQTDCNGSDVENVYFELSLSSGSSISLTMSNLDLSSSDEINEISTRKRRVMSSQTNLTLSDFDLEVVSQESEDFEDDLDEGLDDSFNPYEQLVVQPSHHESWYASVAAGNALPGSGSSGIGPLPEALSAGGPDAERQCQQFFELLRNRCNIHSQQRHATQLDGNFQLCAGDLANKETSALLSRFGGNRSGGRNATCRMVPKMGTKVDFGRPLTSSPSSSQFLSCLPWQIPLTVQTKRDFPSAPADACVDGGRGCARPPQFWNDIDRVPLFPVSLSHSDSERSNNATPFSLLNLKEWNSDGDTKNMSLPSSDDSAERSPDSIGGIKHDPEKMDSLRMLYEQYADVMYTNEANLQHTIMVQQRLFEQQLANRVKRSNEHQQRGDAPVSTNKPGHLDQNNSWLGCPDDRNTPGFEWVIKRRADGTRYITRRPVPKTRMIKDRMKPTSADNRRCVATTTDDDAISEPKTGRYWTREERKQHLERARNQKRVKEGARNIPAKEIQFQEPNLGQMKKTKVKKEHRARTTQDGGAITFQDFLGHGKIDIQGKSENPLLSVITI